MLNDEKLCDLFYREYRAEHAETDAIYRRYQFVVATIALLAGVVGAITRRDLLSQYRLRVDVFLYYTFAGLAGLCLVLASACLVISIKPRKFQHLDGLEKWRLWRQGYRQEVVESGYGDGEPALIDAAVALATCDQAIERFAEAADWNAGRNRIKLRWFNYSFYFIVAAIGAVALQAIMHAVLFLNGVKLNEQEAATIATPKTVAASANKSEDGTVRHATAATGPETCSGESDDPCHP